MCRKATLQKNKVTINTHKIVIIFRAEEGDGSGRNLPRRTSKSFNNVLSLS
jgi:hypothetical protein